MSEYTLEDLQEELRSIEEELEYMVLHCEKHPEDVSEVEPVYYDYLRDANALRIAIERFEK